MKMEISEAVRILKKENPRLVVVKWPLKLADRVNIVEVIPPGKEVIVVYADYPTIKYPELKGSDKYLLQLAILGSNALTYATYLHLSYLDEVFTIFAKYLIFKI